MTEGKEWLAHFVGSDRARAGRLFYQAVRDGAETAREVCSLVYRQSGARLKLGGFSADEHRLLVAVRAWLLEDKEGALALAAFCLEFHAATPEVRAALVGKKR